MARSVSTGDADVAAAAALLAEPARAAFVGAVLEEGPLPAAELARRAAISPSTASEHLARLVAGGILVRTDAARRRLYAVSSPLVAEAFETLARIAPQRPVRSLREATNRELIQQARTCYDHLAGRLGVAVAAGLEQRQVVERQGEDYVLGREADSFLRAFDIDADGLRRQRRPLVRGCLDWSERELHLAGATGAALTTQLFVRRWIRRRPGSRAVAVTPAGVAGFRDQFAVDVASSTMSAESSSSSS